MTTLRLGLRLVRGGGRAGFVRLALMVLGTALGVWCLLAALAFPKVIAARQDRADARFPNTVPAKQARGWIHRVERELGGRELGIVLVAAEPQTPVPPGVDELPEVGEAIVSPELAQELQTGDSTIPFPYPAQATIGPPGLVGPDELFAYVGATRRQLPGGGLPLGSFGADLNPEIDVAQGNLRFIELAFVGLAGVPLAVYFSVCARLSAATRERRLAALRLIGMGARQTQRVNAVEAVVGATAGSVLGLLLFDLTQGLLASSGAGGFVWFSSDSDPSLGAVLLCALGVPILAAFLSVAGSRDAVKRALFVRRQSRPRPPGLWRLIPLAVGVGTLCGVLVMVSSRPPGVGGGDVGSQLLLIGVVLTGLGLALGFGAVTVALARSLAAKTSRLSVLLATRRLEFEPSSATRVVSGLVVVVFGMGFATGIQRDAEAAALPLGDVQIYSLTPGELGDRNVSSLRSIEALDAVSVRLEVGGSGTGGNGFELLWTSCADLEVFIDRAVPSCKEDTAYRVLPDKGGPILKVPDRGRIPLPAAPRPEGADRPSVEIPDRVLRLSRNEIFDLGIPGVLLPPEDLPGDVAPRMAEIGMASRADPETVERVVGEVARIAPAANLQFENANLEARRHAQTFQSMLDAALILGLVVGALAFVVAALDRAVERRANLVSLSVVGTPTRTLRAAQAIQVAVPMAVGAVLAVLGGKLAEQAVVATGGFARGWEWQGLLVGAMAALVAIAASIVMTTLAVSDRTDVSLIRRE